MSTSLIYRGYFISDCKDKYAVHQGVDPAAIRVLYLADSEDDARDWIDARIKASRQRP